MPWSLYPISEFTAMEPIWKGLNECSADTPLLDPDFVRPLLRVFGTGKERLAVWRTNGQPAAMAIIRSNNPLAWTTFQPKQAPLGCWLQEPSLPTAQLVRELLEALRPKPLVVAVLHQDPELRSVSPTSPTVKVIDYIPTASIVFSGTFDSYWKQRSKNFRHTISRQQNVLKREGRSVRLEQITATEGMERAVADYGRIESAGWKGSANTAVSADNEQGRFYVEMLRNFARNGEALVSRYLYDGRLVASDINLHRNGVLYTLKTTYDEAERATSPAQLMKRDLYERLVDDSRLARVEYYGQVMEWHNKWKTGERTLFHVNVYRWPLVHRLNQALKAARRRMIAPLADRSAEAGAKH